VVVLALTAFPHAILPNTLVRELAALCRRAGLQVPLVEEVAADIFMGTFTLKWPAAAEVASRTLDGRLYARYYDHPPAAVWQNERRETPAVQQRLRAPWEKDTAEDFAAICRARTREVGGPGGSWDTAGNGTVLEQSQILTTHNLAVLVDALGLQPRLEQLAPALADQALDWVVRTWQRLRREQHAAPSLAPAVDGLAHLLGGGRFDASGRTATGRRLLGWSVEPHWLLQPDVAESRRA
jgi:hypothetical protein